MSEHKSLSMLRGIEAARKGKQRAHEGLSIAAEAQDALMRTGQRIMRFKRAYDNRKEGRLRSIT